MHCSVESHGKKKELLGFVFVRCLFGEYLFDHSRPLFDHEVHTRAIRIIRMALVTNMIYSMIQSL